jgi:hypothetical protein
MVQLDDPEVAAMSFATLSLDIDNGTPNE